MNTLFVIRIKNTTAYLGFEDNGKSKWFNGENALKTKACVFGEEREARAFAEKKFTKFRNWEVPEVTLDELGV